MAASSVMEREEVLLARIAPGLANLSRDREDFELHFHFLGDRFD